MALPSSGQISFNDVRTEMSQSEMTNFSMYEWATGASFPGSEGGGLPGARYFTHTPINILSSGSRWEDGVNDEPKRMTNNGYEGLNNNYSMSAWYNYDRNLYIDKDVTSSLYFHSKLGQPYLVQTMLPINIGTIDSTININISGTLYEESDFPINVDVWYGKPWTNEGSVIQGNTLGLSYNNTLRYHVTYSQVFPDVTAHTASLNFSYQWQYYYTASVGQYIYVVLSSKYVPL